MLTQQELKYAREWIADCMWTDLDEDDIRDLTDSEVVTGIKRHYSGGIEAFKAACQ